MHSLTSLTYYQRLGLSPGASPEAIRRAYRQLSKRYHPDTSPLAPEVAIRRFQELQEAYLILSNPLQRAIYDASLRAVLSNPGSAERDSLELRMETRPLSGGEICALLLMGSTFLMCLLLAGTLAWLRESGAG
ncbi:J domain-containing protein [Thermostichus vulcanus]|uniref:J domain-containing protein n=1 Tax=Thermostichus vulcanus str. 'Rupite' TaxID=2813851 RepID=A0ABT0C955_THEVL|nr:J domain-containing protein [Thermostichus vulcanus]MCJ2542323.1 J domain-containing protein [Thermostichus vulcanus str. 'Rupite']